MYVVFTLRSYKTIQFYNSFTSEMHRESKIFSRITSHPEAGFICTTTPQMVEKRSFLQSETSF